MVVAPAEQLDAKALLDKVFDINGRCARAPAPAPRPRAARRSRAARAGTARSARSMTWRCVSAAPPQALRGESTPERAHAGQVTKTKRETNGPTDYLLVSFRSRPPPPPPGERVHRRSRARFGRRFSSLSPGGREIARTGCLKAALVDGDAFMLVSSATSNRWKYVQEVRRPPPPPPPPLRTKWTRRVPHPVLIGHAASLTRPLSTRPLSPPPLLCAAMRNDALRCCAAALLRRCAAEAARGAWAGRTSRRRSTHSRRSPRPRPKSRVASPRPLATSRSLRGPAPAPVCARAALRGKTLRSSQYGGRDETCPISTEGGTRRVHSVREGGGGGLRGDIEDSSLLACEGLWPAAVTF